MPARRTSAACVPRLSKRAAAKLWLGGANDDGVGGPGQHADGGAASSVSPPIGPTRPRHQRDIAASSPAYGDDADAEKSRRAAIETSAIRHR
ncbi:hypothetical protein ATCC90586_011458 [Pythium insidiosum]|nr:hypothetical protein ATCC90586_011458 [Pythium insidiosum]